MIAGAISAAGATSIGLAESAGVSRVTITGIADFDSVAGRPSSRPMGTAANGRSLIEGTYGAPSVYLTDDAVAAEMLRIVALTTRLNRRPLERILPRFILLRIALDNSQRAKTCGAAESFRRRKRHCSHRIPIEISFENYETASTGHQPADHERYDAAAEA